VSRRGRTVAGTSAHKNRTARRQARKQAALGHHEGEFEAPKSTVPAEQLEEIARQRREEASGERRG
jgi:hypothetical protein